MGFLSKIGGTLNDLLGTSDANKTAYSQNVALWNMQNQYNTPAAQIARMKEAGIDVNPMTYAVGNGNMSSVASTPSPASMSGSGVNPIGMAMSVMSGIKDLEFKDKEIDRKAKEVQLLQKDIENYEHNHSSPYKDLADVVKYVFGLGASDNGTSFFGKGTSRNQPRPIDSSKPAIGRNKKSGTGSQIKWFPWQWD